MKRSHQPHLRSSQAEAKSSPGVTPSHPTAAMSGMGNGFLMSLLETESERALARSVLSDPAKGAAVDKLVEMALPTVTYRDLP